MLKRFFARDTQAPPRAEPILTALPGSKIPASSAPARPAAAPRSDGRARELTIIARPSDIPTNHGTISGPAGRLPLSDEDRRHFAVLSVDEARVIVVWSNRQDTLRQFRLLTARLQQEHLAVAALYEGTPEILAALHDPARNAGPIAVTLDYQGPMAQLFDKVVAHAVREKASDIHIQVNPQGATILLRVHGDLEYYMVLPHSDAKHLCNAIYNMFADNDTKKVSFNEKQYLDTSITRVVEVDGAHVKLKLRFASMPVYPDGWDIVLRVLPIEIREKQKSLAELGYAAPQCHAFDRMIAKPTGAIVVCGTTGSGKSTTLMTLAGMYHVHHNGHRLVRTLEDPPEYIIPNARQTPVVRGEGQSEDGFARGLRAAMRGDPDMILAGEVRDESTARLLMQAVQTGHKVLTTVHAGNPFDAIERLIDLGATRSVVATDGFLSGVVYQRLVPVLCPHCAVDVRIAAFAPELMQRLIKTSKGDALGRLRFRGAGCEACGSRGVVGRTVVADFLVPDRQILDFIAKEDILAARAYWRARVAPGDAAIVGRTALDQAIDKMNEGLVSPIDVEKELGYLDDEEAPERARAWLFARQPELHAAREHAR